MDFTLPAFVVTNGTLSALTEVDPTHYTALFTPTPDINATATIQVQESGTGGAVYFNAAHDFTTASNVVNVAVNTMTQTFYFGLNLSGAENEYPVFPTLAEMTWWKNRGVTYFRIPFGWSSPNPTYGIVGVQPTAFGPLDTTSTYLPLTGNNQLYQSEDMTQAVWFPNGGAIIHYPASVPLPTGVNSASSITDVSGSNNVFAVDQNINAALGDIVSVFFRPGSQNFACIQINMTSTPGFIASCIYFNLLTGTVLSTQLLAGSVSPISFGTMTSAGNGWWRCSATITMPNVGGCTMYFNPANSDGGRFYVGTGSIAAFVTGAQLNVGPTLLAYQAVSGGYVNALDQVFDNADSLGLHLILDCHTFGGGPGNLAVGSPGLPISAMVDMWSKVATRYGNRPSLYAIEYMNEPVNGFNSATIQSWCQQLNTTLRASPINYIGQVQLDGTNYTGAWNYVSGQGQPYNNSNFYTVTDPLNNQVFVAHSYFDFDSSGTNFAYNYQTTVAGVSPPGLNTSSSIGVSRLSLEYLPWLTAHNTLGVYSEFGVSNDPIVAGGTNNFQAWFTAAQNAVDLAQANNLPVLMWGAGPGFAPNQYPFCPTPYNVTNIEAADFSAAGVQSVQMAFINRYVTNPMPELLAYTLKAPVTVTTTTNPEAPIVIPDLYAVIGTPSNVFTVIGGGTIPNGTIITPHAFLEDGVTSAGGTFTPSSITLSANDYLFATFTYTAATTATIVIVTTNNQGFIDPPAVSISTQDDPWFDTGLTPAPLYNLYRSYTPYNGPALQLQHPTTGALMNWSFTKGNNLDRVAIQAWAGQQSGIPVTMRYDQSPNDINLPLTGATLNLQNSTGGSANLGYPEIVYSAMNGTAAVQVSRTGAMTIIARMNEAGTSGNAPYISTFLFSSGAPYNFGPIGDVFQIENTGYIGATTIATNQIIGSVSLGITHGAWHNYTATYQQGASPGLVAFLDGTSHTTSNITPSATSTFTFTQTGTIATIANLLGIINIGDTATGTGIPASNAFVSQNSDGSYNMSKTATVTNVAAIGFGIWYGLNTGFDNAGAQFGFVSFGSSGWQGSDTMTAFLPAHAITHAQLATVLGYENTHYTNALPDVLPPIFVGVTNQSIVSGTPIAPFASFSLQDVAGTTDTIVFTLTGNAGTLSGTGLTGSGPYTLTTDTVANINTKLKALSFSTTGSTGAVTNIAMVATSSTTLTATANPTVTINAASNPVISGMVAPNVSMDQGAPALWQVLITDANPSPMVSASITITGASGTLSHIGPTGPTGTGPYTFAADTPANLTRWLRNLLWAPATHTAGTTTTFALTVTNALTLTATASNTITNVAPQSLPSALTPINPQHLPMINP